ncbi:acetate/propionate family kinase [Agilicoccus flavus]|uniref:acetate/propionate family kinase n=1 Tax=Agilicoccus flavus TaxID=2775968 RepID=UPI001CF61173|nr:acetate kinase [Agilicoccus flavus]
MSTVLVVNAGSSSIKYQLLDPDTREVSAKGLLERIGQAGGELTHRVGEETTTRRGEYDDHGEGLQAVLDVFEEVGPSLSEAGIVAVGHRVVQGGKAIDGPRLVDDALETEIDRLASLAPLHNPPNLAAIRVARELMPQVPHVAVFDTAFFHDLPDHSATYAIDAATAEQYAIRRYGFHGTSHKYVSAQVAERLGRDDLRTIVLHLGNGASASAVVGGVPVDTSMGMTPLEGLVMGTRSGDLDPAILFHLHRVAGLDVDALDTLLNKKSGLLGMCGSNDMRDVTKAADAGEADAALALAVYTYRLRRYVGAYAAAMGGLDAVAFTAGVGENSPRVRWDSLAGLEFLGIRLDEARNAAGDGVISADDSAVTVLVVPTDEELEIARQAAGFARPSGG